MKHLKKISKKIAILAIIGFISIPLLLTYLVTGLYDVFRQKSDQHFYIFKRYFYGNGGLTWIFSPVNLIIDIVSLPFINKQIYKLEDFPEKYRDEINEITLGCEPDKLIEKMRDQLANNERALLLYKWYGHNVGDGSGQPNFHKKFRYILTIGLSVFNANEKTKEHFGWLRAGVRVLYNIDPVIQDGAYIVVNGFRHDWKKDGRLFIFDDTLMHQSFNLTDMPRHCLFIDIVRPSYIPGVVTALVKSLGAISMAIPSVKRSSRWKVLS
ncbi:MAG: aspartyl/asparaginyl beta-hydroxylase domain-containing protein [Gammaproteobacteria bacterium]|nr:aspartyl/asparaginyl beta-hydroxylase domain-containing protein [Gammaproteobacteria bacterium]